MLPAPKTERPSLADVLRSSRDAVLGGDNRLDLPPVDTAIILLVDGLGVETLAARAGHARTLAAASGAKNVIESGFPTTTASALASLTTGVSPGEHGLVGYTVLDPAHDRIVNQLSGWDALMPPEVWQREPTLFESAPGLGIEPIAIGVERYRTSGFTRAVLRGARFEAAPSIAARAQRAIDELRGSHRRLIYLYVPELDQAAHAHGWQSEQWTTALEATDAAVRELSAALGPRQGLIVTADHGLLDIPQHSHVLLDDPALLDGIRFIAGEPRCLQLYFEPDLVGPQRDALVEAWRRREGHRAWIATRDEAIAVGWFGTVHPEVLPRIGDLIVAARKAIAYYDGRLTDPPGRSMIAQHGSWSPAELRVPLLRFGAFA
jgi:hypothetical protein